ncbi:butyrophilin subfamily 3 member A2-like [Cyprinodon tularosa]|uniref:butyrophilin subfamily 3 member A2-like n=1 Tax=Cyprinodon tularosa TaxID=77115 RepID=UPI0018E28AD7|nr:butyrophilin subfamily 3 member A2-like [Cyprinodon tularosa]
MLSVNLFILLLIHTCKGQSKDMDSSKSVTAMVGENVILPCHLEPPKDASQMTVEWGRPDLKPRFVFVNLDGHEYSADQNEAYKGRSSIIPDNLKNGDISLRLSAVRHSDNGKYRCYLPKLKKENFVNLVVGSASSPDISLAGLDESNNGVMLDCSSAGWFPEPEVLWMHEEEIIISAGPTEKIEGPDGLYTISSRVTVEKRHNNNITCRVQQRDINQTRETSIYVQDGFFVPRSNCSISVTFSVILGLILLLGVAAFIWKRRQTETSMKKRNDEVNEKKQQLRREEEEYVAKKKSDLEVQLRKRNQDQRIIDQQIEALMKMSEELKEQKKQLTDQRQEAVKIVEENDRKLKAIDDEVTNQSENKMEKKAQGYLKLKEIITESNERLNERKKDHQHVELITQKLMEKTSQEVKKLKEIKQEIENHVVEIEKQLKEMVTCDFTAETEMNYLGCFFTSCE